VRLLVFLDLLELLLLHFEPVFFIASLNLGLKPTDTATVEANAKQFCCLLNATRWQIDRECKFIADCDPVRLCKDDRLGNLLTIGLVATIVFDLDVEVETALTGVTLGAFGVGAGQLSMNFICTSPIMLLTPRQVPFASRAFEIFVAIVELLELEDAL